MNEISKKAKLLLPVALSLVLVACGTPPVPPTVVVPSPLGNPLAGLPTNLPANELNAAMQGLNALGQLGQSIDANGQMQNAQALNNFANTLNQIEQQQAAQSYQMVDPVDMPEGTPDIVKQFNYTNGKLVGASIENSEPLDIRLTYNTLDPVTTVTSYYRQLIKNPLPTGWKVKSQMGGAESGYVELQKLEGSSDDRMKIDFSKEGGLTEVKVRYYNYSR